jgi:DNA-binding PadR family transcriptional regulator
VTVKHALLALLDHRATYGYQLHGLMEETLGNPWSINVGQIYSTLSRLERDGFVERRQNGQDEKDKDRKIYEITEKGKDELVRWLQIPLSREDRSRRIIYTKFVLSRLSGSITPEEMLQIQRSTLLSEMHELTHLRSEADSKSDIYWILLLENSILHLEADLRWLDFCESGLAELSNEPDLRYETRGRGRPKKT